MNDTIDPTVERLRHTFQAVADQVVDTPPVFDGVPVSAAPPDAVNPEVKYDGVLEPVGAATVIVSLESARLVRTGRRRWLIAVAAVAAAALLVAGTVLVTGTGEQHLRTKPAGSDPSLTTIAPGTVLPLRNVRESELGLDLPGESKWLDAPKEVGKDVQIGAVVVGGPGLVAVGHDFGNAAVWTSEDGRTWSRVPDDEAVFGGPGFQGMWDVTVGGPGFVAVGRDSSFVGSDTYAVAAVWTSPDGVTWSRVAHDDAVFGRGTGEPNEIFKMTAVTTGGPGLVAIGGRGGASDQVGVSGAFIADREVGAVWTSIDGIAWSRVPHDPAVFGQWPTSPDPAPADWGLSAQMRDITSGGPGLVVVGDIYRGGRRAVAGAVWTSPDGIRWTLAADQIEGFLAAVTAGGPGLVAVGAADGNCCDPGTLTAAVWTSIDGITWSRVPSQADVLGGPGMQWMTSVAAGGPGLVATGPDESRPSGGDQLTVWTSVDGITWSRTSDHALETLLRLYGFDGSRPLSSGGRPRGPAPAPIAPEPTPLGAPFVEGPDAASTLLTSWGQIHVGYAFVYADGRVIWYPDIGARVDADTQVTGAQRRRRDNGVPAPDGEFRYEAIERHLSPHGLELVRAGKLTPKEFLVSDFDDPDPQRREELWAEPTARVYEASTYAICHTPAALAPASAQLPADAQALLSGKQRTVDPKIGWSASSEPMPEYLNMIDEMARLFPSDCFEVTAAEASTLYQILDANGLISHDASPTTPSTGTPPPGWFAGGSRFAELRPGASYSVPHISSEPIYPHGQPVRWGG